MKKPKPLVTRPPKATHYLDGAGKIHPVDDAARRRRARRVRRRTLAKKTGLPLPSYAGERTVRSRCGAKSPTGNGCVLDLGHAEGRHCSANGGTWPREEPDVEKAAYPVFAGEVPSHGIPTLVDAADLALDKLEGKLQRFLSPEPMTGHGGAGHSDVARALSALVDRILELAGRVDV